MGKNAEMKYFPSEVKPWNTNMMRELMTGETSCAYMVTKRTPLPDENLRTFTLEWKTCAAFAGGKTGISSLMLVVFSNVFKSGMRVLACSLTRWYSPTG